MNLQATRDFNGYGASEMDNRVSTYSGLTVQPESAQIPIQAQRLAEMLGELEKALCSLRIRLSPIIVPTKDMVGEAGLLYNGSPLAENLNNLCSQAQASIRIVQDIQNSIQL